MLFLFYQYATQLWNLLMSTFIRPTRTETDALAPSGFKLE
jgi:hypothetical protein